MTIQKNIFLLPLLAIGCALAAVTGTAGPTGKPEFFEAVRTFSYNDCGYQIDVTVEGRLIFWREPGFKSVSSQFDHTLTNPETGETIVLKMTGPQTEWDVVREDGLIEHHFLTSGAWRLVVPGVETTIAAGKLHTAWVEDPATGEMVDFIVYEFHGPGPAFDPVICELLAP